MRSAVASSWTFPMPGPLFICMPTWTTRPEPTKRLAHAPGMVGIERHGLLLIHVFARLDRRHEVQRVLVLRRGDQDRIERLLLQQPPEISCRSWLPGLSPSLPPAGAYRHQPPRRPRHRDSEERPGKSPGRGRPPRSKPKRMRSLAPRTRPGAISPEAASQAALPIVCCKKVRRLLIKVSRRWSISGTRA